MKWLFLSFLLFSCTQNRVLKVVGEFPIYQKDVDHRNAVHRVVFPGDQRNLGLEVLTQAHLRARVLKSHGHEITAKEIDEEWARIQRDSRQPEVLAKIQGILRNDLAAVKRVYVFPHYVDQKISKFFYDHPVFHTASEQKAKQFVEKIKKRPKHFQRLAEEAGLRVRVLRKEAEPELVQKIQGTTALPIPLKDSWLVAIPTKRPLEFHAVHIPKRDFEGWLRTEIDRVRPS